jgi:hypothetical protein
MNEMAVATGRKTNGEVRRGRGRGEFTVLGCE